MGEGTTLTCSPKLNSSRPTPVATSSCDATEGPEHKPRTLPRGHRPNCGFFFGRLRSG